MKILVIADAGCHSGFSTVNHNIFERLAAMGHDVSVIAINFKGDFWPTPLKLYVPTLDEPNDTMGMHRYVELVGKIMPDAIVFVNDPKVVLNCLTANPWDPQGVLWRGIQGEGGYTYKPPIIGYLAIDGYESPGQWDLLAERVTRVAMSRFGQAAMPEAPVVWHGVDTSVFHPGDKAEAKRELGFDPDRFLVLRVDKNTWRKDYPSSWKALRPVLRAHPDIDVHFHCRPTAPDGYDINAVRWNDADIRDRATFSADLGGFTGWPEERLATLFRAGDLFLSTSWGEGFGLNALQSMACGTPVLAQDCSAITEVVGPGGVLVKPRGRMSVPMGQEQCLPDVEKFSYWLEHLYSSRKMREAFGVAAVAQAQKFSWDVAASKFATIIEREVAKAAH